MLKKLVAGAGCVVLGTCLAVPAAIASRGTRTPEVPPTSRPPADEEPAEPPEVVAPPSETASPPEVPEAPPLTSAAPEPPPVPQDVEASPDEETSRSFAGTVTDPPLPAPAPAPRPTPARLPFTGAGDDALPLAGAALALGGLALMVGPPARPAPPTEPVRLLQGENAAAIPSDPGGGGDGRRRGRRLWRIRRR